MRIVAKLMFDKVIEWRPRGLANVVLDIEDLKGGWPELDESSRGPYPVTCNRRDLWQQWIVIS